MRLTCPNCEAQYEVSDEMIPSEGRDVQCSSCGHTWYQIHPHAPLPQSDQDDDADPSIDVEADQDDDAGDPPVEAAKGASLRIDPAISDILREEAAQESLARATEASDSAHTTPDLTGLEPSESDAPSEQMIVAAANRSRRDLLPNIDEINSTLRSKGDRTRARRRDFAAMSSIAETRRRNFRRGFAAAIFIIGVFAGVYIWADRIVDVVPQSQETVQIYVDYVEQARAALDVQSTRLLVWINETLG